MRHQQRAPVGGVTGEWTAGCNHNLGQGSALMTDLLEDDREELGPKQPKRGGTASGLEGLHCSLVVLLQNLGDSTVGS